MMKSVKKRGINLGLVGLVAIAIIVTGVAMPAPSNVNAAKEDHAQADSVKFRLHLGDAEHQANDVVYCGVKRNAEPFTLSIAASSPPMPVEGGNEIDGPFSPTHDGAAWLSVGMQNDGNAEGTYLSIPTNSSAGYNLTLGGQQGVDQLVRLSSPPKGDGSGSGADITGFATVRARQDAVDPFDGDGRNDNFCLTVDHDGQGSSEYTEGEISTTLPVPNAWVVDGNGADGGVLTTLPY